jgi:heme oxygenase
VHHAACMDTLDLREALRRETRDQQVESESLTLRVLESEADGYAAFLVALHSLHLAARELCSRYRSDLPSLEELNPQPRLELLEWDLAELGTPLETAPPAAFDFRSAPEVLGLLSAIEDSTLGGATAARRVRALWNVLGRGTPPLRYLCSEGLDVGARWRAYVRCIDGFSVAHPDAHHAVISGARKTWAELNARLSRAWPEAVAAAPA